MDSFGSTDPPPRLVLRSQVGHLDQVQTSSFGQLELELFDRLFEGWSTLDRFQRTRGVLRLVNAVVGPLWRSNDAGALIVSGSVPLHVDSVAAEPPSRPAAKRMVDQSKLALVRAAYPIRPDLDGVLAAARHDGHLPVGDLRRNYTTCPYLTRMLRPQRAGGRVRSVDSELRWQLNGFATRPGTTANGRLDIVTPQ